jgi:predicted ATPase
MRIDIHTHTKKVKQGDSENRNIDVTKFTDVINKTDVKILAITNHNHFDYEQYKQFQKSVEGTCQIWPGVEFDIIEEGRRAHLIIIVNPKNAEGFGKKVNEVVGTTSADSFSIKIEDVVNKFNDLDTIYIAHYQSKKPNLVDKDVDRLVNLVSNPKRVLKEASNSISAGIYINHGHNSIHGSDVHNWDNYVADSKNLPELRLPVESFEQFCLLLDKDDTTIKTILDQKTPEPVQITPFGIAELINLDIYNDINILFGSKGTGKTEILKALSTYFNIKGHKTEVYESNSRKLDDVFDLKGNLFTIDIQDLGIDNCSSELASVRNATERGITSLSVYHRYYSDESKNKIVKTIKVNKLTLLDENSPKRSFDEVKSDLKKFSDFKRYVSSNTKLKEVIGEDLLTELESTVNRILEKINSESGNRFVDYKTVNLFNKLIQVFVNEISKKTGQAVKPTKTGFYEYSSNRVAIEKSIKKIRENIAKTITPIVVEVGDLGDKGKLVCQTNLIFQNGAISDSEYKHIQSKTKVPQKNVASQIEIISKHIYANSLFEKIDELKKIEGSETVTSIGDLLLFNRHFVVNGNPYTPSNGESSMVLLHNELMKDKEIYLIDEPEKSLGNDYISDIIVPLIKERAKSGKKVIIATHDANIAVRTLPYNSIYRLHNVNQSCYTFVGNPFTNNLKCINGSKADLDWKLISMKTLEGGKAAFGERGKIYGNTQRIN